MYFHPDSESCIRSPQHAPSTSHPCIPRLDSDCLVPIPDGCHQPRSQASRRAFLRMLSGFGISGTPTSLLASFPLSLYLKGSYARKCNRLFSTFHYHSFSRPRVCFKISPLYNFHLTRANPPTSSVSSHYNMSYHSLQLGSSFQNGRSPPSDEQTSMPFAGAIYTPSTGPPRMKTVLVCKVCNRPRVAEARANLRTGLQAMSSFQSKMRHGTPV